MLEEMKKRKRKGFCFLCGKETDENDNGLCKECEEKLENKKNEREYIEKLEKEQMLRDLDIRR